MLSAFTVIVLGLAFFGTVSNTDLETPSITFLLPSVNVSLILPQSTSQPECGGRLDYIYTQFIGCHKVHSSALSWNDARRTCLAEGSHLAVIDFDAEGQVIAQLLREKGYYLGWIGVHDMFKETEFVSIFSNPLTYLTWAPGEPNDAHAEGEDCVAISYSGKLQDSHCDTIYHFVCEIPYIQPCRS